jgi:hypothetical protein
MGVTIIAAIALAGAALLACSAVLVAFGPVPLALVAAWCNLPGTSSAVLTLSPGGPLREGAIIVASIMAIRYIIDAPVRAAFDSTRRDP